MAKIRYPSWYTYIFWLVYVALAINFFFIHQKNNCVAYTIYIIILLIINVVGLYNNLIIWKHLNKLEKVFDAVGSVVFFVSLILFTRLFINECLR